MMSFELISFKTCPFVQRAAITLGYKNVEHTVTFIDLAEPPDWFLDLSPLKKVPVLKVDGEILFESAVINEYLDEITGGELQPKDPLERAMNRAWIEFASNMLGNSYMMKNAPDKEKYEKYRDALVSQLHRVENRLGEGPWFNGEQFSLADTAFAPLFAHDAVADYRFSSIDPASTPKVDAWSKRLLALPAVKNSVVSDFDSLFLAGLEKADSYSWHQYAA
ncbi:MAG: glutathione S-transferase family protein [Proteobacteria bacterium]|nr:glutathione S-transferase family protein [Pseudomonadota bacterium]